MGTVRRSGLRPRLIALLLAPAALAALAPGWSTPAWADPGESAEEGYVMVQQALSFLVNDAGPAGVAQAAAMVDDALAAEDQDGVDVPALEDARAALDAGRADDARDLMQSSIEAALAARGPATGEETGTTVVLPPFAAGPLSPTDWLYLVLSALVAAGGVVLSVLFRPRKGLRELRREMAAARSAVDTTRRRNA